MLTSFYCYSKEHEPIYIADLEVILVNIKDYKPINNELLIKKNKLSNDINKLEEKLKELKMLKFKNNGIFNENGISNLNKKIMILELNIKNQKLENENTLLELERSLKFPLIRKILYYIKNNYDQSRIPFIVDKDSIFYYKKDHIKTIDLTNKIINDINKIELDKFVLD